MNLHRLCCIAEIDDPGARLFEFGEPNRDGDNLDPRDWPVSVFVVRQGDQVHGYINRCPHAGHQLNWIGERFLNRERDHILCASHGAMFEIDSGVCIAGPCPGERLLPVALEIEAGEIAITAATLRALEARQGAISYR